MGCSPLSIDTPYCVRCFSLLCATNQPTTTRQALQVAQKLQPPWPYVGAAGLWFPQPVREAVYDLVASNRYQVFGRTEACQRPPKELLERFIDRDELEKPP